MEDAVTMTQLIPQITEFVTAGISWMGDVAQFVTSNALTILMVIAVPLSGWGIGGLKRLTRL